MCVDDKLRLRHGMPDREHRQRIDGVQRTTQLKAIVRQHAQARLDAVERRLRDRRPGGGEREDGRVAQQALAQRLRIRTQGLPPVCGPVHRRRGGCEDLLHEPVQQGLFVRDVVIERHRLDIELLAE